MKEKCKECLLLQNKSILGKLFKPQNTSGQVHKPSRIAYASGLWPWLSSWLTEAASAISVSTTADSR